MEQKDFINRLVELRMEKGVSARDMSLSIGQSVNYINSIESGKSLPSLTGLFYICEYFGISPAEFFDINTRNPVKLQELIKSACDLNTEQLNHLISIIKDLKRY